LPHSYKITKMPDNKDYKEIWENVYAKRFMTLWSLPEGVVQFVGRFLRKRLTIDKYEDLFPAKHILDLGCGNGAVVAFLAKQEAVSLGKVKKWRTTPTYWRATGMRPAPCNIILMKKKLKNTLKKNSKFLMCGW